MPRCWRPESIRVRPILMTTLATIAGLTPLALGVGAGAEIQRPLATAIIGGLVVSTLVSVFVIPSLVRLAFRASPSSPSLTSPAPRV